MKTAIISMFELPRKLHRGHLDLEDCEHAGNFSSEAVDCAVCDCRVECEWLYHNDEFTALVEKPVGDLLLALDAAVLYVDACVARADHDLEACRCDACTWLERARVLLADTPYG